MRKPAIRGHVTLVARRERRLPEVARMLVEHLQRHVIAFREESLEET